MIKCNKDKDISPNNSNIYHDIIDNNFKLKVNIVYSFKIFNSFVNDVDFINPLLAFSMNGQ